MRVEQADVGVGGEIDVVTLPSPGALVRDLVIMVPMILLSLFAMVIGLAAVVTSGTRAERAAGLARRCIAAVISLGACGCKAPSHI